MCGRYSPELKPPKMMPFLNPERTGMIPAMKMFQKMGFAKSALYTPSFGNLSVERTKEAIVISHNEAQNTMLFLHGGAFYLPLSIASLDLAAYYAERLQLRVILPEYPLLPEHRAPDAFLFCLEAYRCLTRSGFLLYGESAGGSLAAALALYGRDHGLPKANGLVLVYPTLDDEMRKYPSASECCDGRWSLEDNLAMWRSYLKMTEEEYLAYLVPMKNCDLGMLPDTYIEPQEFDILKDEAVLFAEQMKKAGNSITLNLVHGSYHGFDEDMESPLVKRVLEERVCVMKTMLENRSA
ncbi:MAG: hypothetical protein EOM45_05065 [Clostridia bacterium]|nr:hypothetical protein [Clostridia bacterium]